MVKNANLYFSVMTGLVKKKKMRFIKEPCGLSTPERFVILIPNNRNKVDFGFYLDD